VDWIFVVGGCVVCFFLFGRRGGSDLFECRVRLCVGYYGGLFVFYLGVGVCCLGCG